MRWSHQEDELWAAPDPELWELTHNLWVILQTISRAKLKALTADTPYHKDATVPLEVSQILWEK